MTKPLAEQDWQPPSPRTPIVVRCASCAARFGEALGRAARACPHCGELARVVPYWRAIGSGWIRPKSRNHNS